LARTHERAEKNHTILWIVVGMVVCLAVGLGVYFGSWQTVKPSVEIPRLPAQNEPASPATTTDEPETSDESTPQDVSQPVIEVEWETGGPYSERPSLSEGFEAIFIDSQEEARAAEFYAYGEEEKWLVWRTKDGGETWEKEIVPLLQFIPEEQKTLHTLPFGTDHCNSEREWPGWKNLLNQYPLLYNLNMFKSVLVAKDKNNGDIALVAVVEHAGAIPEPPTHLSRDDYERRLQNASHPGSTLTRFFVSLDNEKTWIEITSPPSNWK